MRADVILEKDIAALVDRTLEHFGQLDFAFNNAGVALDGGAGIAKHERNLRPDNEHQRAERLFQLRNIKFPRFSNPSARIIEASGRSEHYPGPAPGLSSLTVKPSFVATASFISRTFPLASLSSPSVLGTSSTTDGAGRLLGFFG